MLEYLWWKYMLLSTLGLQESVGDAGRVAYHKKLQDEAAEEMRFCCPSCEELILRERYLSLQIKRQCSIETVLSIPRRLSIPGTS